MTTLQNNFTPPQRLSTSLLVFTESATNQAFPVNSARLKRLGFPYRKWYLFSLLLIVFAALVSYFNVDRTLTNEDRYYIKRYLPNVAEGIAPSLSYEDQIKLIRNAQEAVHRRTTNWQGIPEGQPREPKQLYLDRTGMCYDRSRVLEKMFTYITSHAISEVLTKKDWLMVDSNDPWISLDCSQLPVSMPQMQARYRRKEKINWDITVLKRDEDFCVKGLTNKAQGIISAALDPFDSAVAHPVFCVFRYSTSS